MPTIKTVNKGDLLAETIIGNHKVLTDLPESWGGKDRGPSSTDLLVASLSSCIMGIVANYCKQAELDATGIEIEISFDYATDPMKLVNIHPHISLPNEELKKRKNAILNAVKVCPVHTTICETDNITVTVG